MDDTNEAQRRQRPPMRIEADGLEFVTDRVATKLQLGDLIVARDPAHLLAYAMVLELAQVSAQLRTIAELLQPLRDGAVEARTMDHGDLMRKVMDQAMELISRSPLGQQPGAATWRPPRNGGAS